MKWGRPESQNGTILGTLLFLSGKGKGVDYQRKKREEDPLTGRFGGGGGKSRGLLFNRENTGFEWGEFGQGKGRKKDHAVLARVFHSGKRV